MANRLLGLMVAATMSAAALSGCKRETVVISGTPAGSGSMKIVAGGDSLATTSCFVSSHIIEGDFSNCSIIFNLEGVPALSATTYTFDSAYQACNVTYSTGISSAATVASYMGSKGSLTLTQITAGGVSGSFSFTTTNGVVVTGTFFACSVL